jgi:hypothetical protein
MACPLAETDNTKIDFDASVQSSALILNAWYRLTCTEDCYYKWGTTPTATSADILLLAGQQRIVQAQGTKLAAIKVNTAGRLDIVRMHLGSTKQA